MSLDPAERTRTGGEPQAYHRLSELTAADAQAALGSTGRRALVPVRPVPEENPRRPGRGR
jgi:hypothetical protein